MPATSPVSWQLKFNFSLKVFRTSGSVVSSFLISDAISLSLTIDANQTVTLEQVIATSKRPLQGGQEKRMNDPSNQFSIFHYVSAAYIKGVQVSHFHHPRQGRSIFFLTQYARSALTRDFASTSISIADARTSIFLSHSGGNNFR